MEFYVEAYYEGYRDAISFIRRGVAEGLDFKSSIESLEAAIEKCQVVNAAQGIANEVKP